MRYVAIDIETSGLDPERCQVLELACVIETDWKSPVNELPRFRTLVNTGEVRGEPYALRMNAGLIAEMVGAPRNNLDGCIIDLWGFIHDYFGESSVTISGKNFAAFDLKFLSRSEAWRMIRHKHRFIDVGSMWWKPELDECLPDLSTCLERAGLSAVRPTHNAVQDCESVIELARAFYQQQVRIPRLKRTPANRESEAK